jgi:hypothetical protein
VREMGSQPTRTAFRSPWQNGVAERWVGSCRRDLLNHVIILNEHHLKRLMSSLSLAKTLGVLGFTPLTMLQACAQAVDFKVGHRFGEGQRRTAVDIFVQFASSTSLATARTSATTRSMSELVVRWFMTQARRQNRDCRVAFER